MPRIFFVALIILTACSANVGDVVSEYKTKARTVGITPVYPPEEGIQVGDIFVQSIPRTRTASSLRENPDHQVKIFFGTSSKFVKQSQDFMGNRIGFLRTEAEDSSGEVAEQRDFVDGRLNTRKQLSIESLPIVAFPEVTADAGVNLGFSSVKLLQAIGLSANQRTQVILNFNDVRKYGVPKLEALVPAQVAVKQLVTQRATQIPNLPAEKGFANILTAVARAEQQALLSEQLRLKSSGVNSNLAPLKDRCKRLLVITEVYLTRKISYTYTNAQILALAANTVIESDNADEQESQTPASPSAPQTNIVINGSPLTNAEGESVSPVTILDSNTIRSAVTSSSKQTNLGKGLTFDTFNARGATFSQTFERPVVIGFDAVTIGFPLNHDFSKIDHCTKQKTQ